MNGSAGILWISSEMNETAIKVEGLGKRYRIGALKKDDQKRSLPGRLFSTFDYLSRMLREPTTEETLWALRDVSFEVKQGEVLGVIGQNGAGKSTLLKLISRITQPTTGRIELYGRVGSMLEVGTGFHPELTGRENIFVNGALMGMTPEEINRKFDAIVEFSGVEKFLDTMVKYYSSGMYVRLAFAVAAHLEPEILVVDEVLAVGDAEFQKKSLGKMDEITKGGRTILFVSHNMVAIRSLCHNAMLMENGSVSMYGKTEDVVENYLQSQDNNLLLQEWNDPSTAPGNDLVRIKRVWLNPENSVDDKKITDTKPIQIGVEYWNLTGINLSIILYFVLEDNVVAFTSGSYLSPEWNHFSSKKGVIRSVCEVPGNLLNTSTYKVNIFFVRNMRGIVYKMPSAIIFSVLENEGREFGWLGKIPGVIKPVLKWQSEFIPENA